MTETVPDSLDDLAENGFVLIKNTLEMDESTAYSKRLRELYDSNHERGMNDVGTVWFDDFLEIDPQFFGRLIAHSSVRAELKKLAGRQVQLRGHYYPGANRQHWHMDF